MKRLKAPPPQGYSDYIWTTREGTRIKVKHMDDGHLNNSIAMMERKAELEGLPPTFFKAYRCMVQERTDRDSQIIIIEGGEVVDEQILIERRLKLCKPQS